MFETKKIATTLKKAKEEEWPYPKTFDALQKLNVDSYEVLIEDYQSRYKSKSGQEWNEPAPEGFSPLKSNDTFDQQGVKKALIRHQQGETNFVNFLEEISKAGVIGYEVSMKSRTVSYFGKNHKEIHQENVPHMDVRAN